MVFIPYNTRCRMNFERITFEDRSYDNKCWIWNGGYSSSSIQNPLGYGIFTENGRKIKCHRWFYEQFLGNVPEGYQLHHKCEQPRCCNPWHLQPITSYEHNLLGNGSPAINARKTECKYGHPLSGDNLVMDRTSRQCRICNNKRSLDSYHSRKGGG